MLSLIGSVGALAEDTASSPADEPYDEWAESPTIHLTCGTFHTVRVIVNGRETENRGIIRRARTFLPGREILERIGAEVTWAPDQQAFYAQFPEIGTTLRLTTDSPVLRAYSHDADAEFGAGREIGTERLSAAPFESDGRVFAPVRGAAEAVGAIVHYESHTRTVYVTRPGEGESGGQTEP